MTFILFYFSLDSCIFFFVFFFSSRRRHTRLVSDWSSDVCSSDLGGAIATIADLRELEVQTEVNENSIGKLKAGMPAEVKVQAYQDQAFKGRVRDIFPSADRAKSDRKSVV